MTNQESRLRLTKDPARFERVEAQLERYPDLSDAEVQEVATYLRTAASLDIGLLSSNKVAWDNSEQLRADRPDLFKTSSKSWAALAAIVIGSLLLLYGFTAIAPV